MLLQSDCVLPSRCGHQHYHEINSNWYGGDVGLCIGIGSNLPYKSSHIEVDMYGYHLPSKDWYAVHAVSEQFVDHTFNINGKTCQAYPNPGFHGYPIQALMVIVNKYNDSYVLPKVYKTYMTTFRTLTNDLAPTTYILEEVNGKYCLPRITPSTISQPKTKRWNSTFDNFPIFKMYNPPCAQTDYSTLQSAISELGLCYDPKGNKLKCNMISQLITCNPLTQTTGYSIPGSKLIVSVLEHILQFIVDFILTTINYIFEELTTILYKLNIDYKLFELLTLMVIAVYYSPSTWTPVLVILTQALTIGLKRT